MAIFSTTVSSVYGDHALVAEASRMVLALRYQKSTILDDDPATCHRAFWVVYHLDKQSRFQGRTSSVSTASSRHVYTINQEKDN